MSWGDSQPDAPPLPNPGVDPLLLPPWITATQFVVLHALVTHLARSGVPYVATGGLAGNLHGARWRLHDLDFDVPHAALPGLARHYAAAVRFGPAAYADDEFELDLLTLRLEGVDVDFSAAESVVLRSPAGVRRPWPTDLREADERQVGGLPVRVLPLERLRAYKRFIGRQVDLRELDTLRTQP